MTEENQSTDNNQTTETNELNIYEISDIHTVKSLYSSMQAKAKEFEIKLINTETQRDDYKNKLDERNRKHHGDVERIGLALMEIAEDKNWCSEYDDFIEELNENLFIELPTRKQNYDVTVKVSREVFAYVTVQVEATSEEDAKELVEEDTYSYLHDLPNNISDWEEQDEDIDVTKVERS